eukprot:3555881-Amphidinium_carterae.3
MGHKLQLGPRAQKAGGQHLYPGQRGHPHGFPSAADIPPTSATVKSLHNAGWHALAILTHAHE